MRSYKWVISKVTIVITHILGLITPVITTHEPPSRPDVGFSRKSDCRLYVGTPNPPAHNAYITLPDSVKPIKLLILELLYPKP